MNLNVLCNNDGQFRAALANDRVDEIIVEADRFGKTAIDECHKAGKKAAIALPYIFRNPADVDVRGYDEVYVRSIDELERYSNFELVGDYGLYGMNPVAVQVLKENGIKRVTAPVELNQYELSALGCEDKEIIVYGHIPMMVSAQCIHKNTGRCDKTQVLTWITDRMGKRLPVENRCDYCYNLIYNPDPVSLAGVFDKVKKLDPLSVRINLTTENAEKSEKVIDIFVSAIQGSNVIDPCDDFTRGHFTRGVE
ncbi:MAG: hypothetical protein Q4E54_02640 [Lachnospiraceae bacterium]|nr:hypothetical protein [Lachnospiraceae bacterium]